MSTDRKLDELTAGSAVADADLIYSLQGGVSVKQTASALASYMDSGAGNLRRVLTGNSVTFYVSPSGSDTTGDGSIGSPWQTPQKAANFIGSSVDGASTNLDSGVIVQMAAGTYTPGAFNAVCFCIDAPGVFITYLGDETTPGNVIWDIQGQQGLHANFGSQIIKGVKFIDTIGGGTAITAGVVGSLTQIGKVDFGSCPGGTHIDAETNSVIFCTNDSYTISGGAAQHCYAANGGVIDLEGATLNITGTPNFSAAFAQIEYGGTLYFFASNTINGSATGKRFILNNAGLIYTTGSAVLDFLPGNTAGTIAPGGAYDELLGTARAPTSVTSASYTVLASDTSLIANRAGTITLTLPSAALNSGRELYVKTIQAQTVVSASSNVVPLIGGSAGTAILAATAGKWAELVSDGTNWIIMSGG